MSIFGGLKLLDDFSTEEKQNLEVFCQEKLVLKGEKFFNEGDEANAMYFLKKGSVSIDKIINDKQINLGVIHAEEIIGEMAIFGDSGKRMAGATALEDCNLITILAFSIHEMTTKHPKLLQRIKDIIEQRNISNKIMQDKHTS